MKHFTNLLLLLIACLYLPSCESKEFIEELVEEATNSLLPISATLDTISFQGSARLDGNIAKLEPMGSQHFILQTQISGKEYGLWIFDKSSNALQKIHRQAYMTDYAFDSKGNIYISSRFEGIKQFDLEGNLLATFTPENTDCMDQIWVSAVEVDESDNLYWGTLKLINENLETERGEGSGLYKYNPNDGTCQNWNTENSELPWNTVSEVLVHNEIIWLAVDRGVSTWATEHREGLVRISQEKMNYINKNTHPVLLSNNIRNLRINSKGRLRFDSGAFPNPNRRNHFGHVLLYEVDHEDAIISLSPIYWARSQHFLDWSDGQNWIFGREVGPRKKQHDPITFVPFLYELVDGEAIDLSEKIDLSTLPDPRSPIYIERKPTKDIFWVGQKRQILQLQFFE